MRFPCLAAALFTTAIAFAGSSASPILKSHNEVKMVDQADSRTEDLQVFADGRVKYEEAPSLGSKKTYQTRLTAQKLRTLTAMLNGKEMRAVPAKIDSKIKVLDGRIDKRLEIRHGSSQQVVEIENFYPRLNTEMPAYPRVLVELECTLQEIQRKATKSPQPNENDNWCPEFMHQHSSAH
jgi:hypothetical protein